MSNPYALLSSQALPLMRGKLVWLFAGAATVVFLVWSASLFGWHGVVTHAKNNSIEFVLETGGAFLISAFVGYTTVLKMRPPSSAACHVATRLLSGALFATATLNTEWLSNTILDVTHMQFAENFDVVVVMMLIGFLVSFSVERSLCSLLRMYGTQTGVTNQSMHTEPPSTGF